MLWLVQIKFNKKLKVGYVKHTYILDFYFTLCNIAEPCNPDWIKDVDARVQFGLKFGKARNFIKASDPVIVVTGWKQGSGFTNTVRIVYVPRSSDPIVV